MEVDFRKLIILVLGIFLVAGLLVAAPAAGTAGDNAKDKTSFDKAKIFEKVSWAKYKDIKADWEKLKIKHKVVNKVLDTEEGKNTAISFVKGLASKMIEKIDAWKEKKIVKDANSESANVYFEDAKEKIGEIISSLDVNMTRATLNEKIKELKEIWKNLVHKNRLYTAEKFVSKASNAIEKMDSVLNKLNDRISTWESMNVDTTTVKAQYNLAIESTANAKTKLNDALETIQSAWDSDDVKLQEVNVAIKNLNIAVHKAVKDIKTTIKEEVKLKLPGEKVSEDETSAEDINTESSEGD